MGFEEAVEIEQEQGRRLRWRRAFLIIAASYAVVFLVALVVMFWQVGVFSSEEPGPPEPDEIALSFRFNREPVTRQFAIDLTNVEAETGDSAETFSVRPASDLRREGDEAGEFPSEQLSVGVTRVAAGRLNLTVTANPWAPERVRDGLYEGVLEVRGGDASASVPISIWLKSREDKWALLALLLLIFGASLGLLVKWITERLTPQAAQWRRLAAIERGIGYSEYLPTLPVWVRLRLEQIEDLIRREDFAGAQQTFGKLENSSEMLAIVSSSIRSIYDQLRGQLEYAQNNMGSLRHEDQFLVKGVIESQHAYIQDTLSGMTEAMISRRHESSPATSSDSTKPGSSDEVVPIDSVPDEEERSVQTLLGELRCSVADGSRLLVAFMTHPSVLLRTAMRQFQTGHFLPEGFDLDRADATPLSEDTGPSISPQTAPIESGKKAFWASKASRARRGSLVIRYARLLAACSSVAIVSLVGMKLEYLDNQGFNGTLSAWLGLLLWSAVVELSGVSVLDVVGRLSTSAGAGAPTSRSAAS